ncbi:PorV/PorQ family protein [Elusimicrobiota bacterium]
MKFRIKKYFIFLLFCLVNSTVSAKINNSGANFLKFGTGARPMGMGGAFVAVADDINSARWNPAGLALLEYNEIMLMHNEAGEGIRHQFLSYGQPVQRIRGTLALNISYFSISDIQGYNPQGVATKELSAYDMSAGLVYGTRPLPYLYQGIALKFIQEKLDTETASAFAMDIGGLWESPVERLRFGYNIQNIGSGLKFIEETSPFPLNLKTGAAYDLRVFGNKLVLAGDVNFPVDYKTYLNAGIECGFFDIIFLRIGYKSLDDLANGLRFGGGIKGNNLKIDYAWLPRGEFDISHRFSMSFRFGRKYKESEIEANIRKNSERGKKYFYAGRFLESYRMFKDILLVAPRHRESQEFISRIELNVENAEIAKEIDTAFSSGIKLYEQGDLTDARASFETILYLSPEHQGALNYIEEIEKRYMEVVESFIKKGVAFYEKTEYPDALKELEKAQALDPENSRVIEYIGMINKNQKELDKIKLELKKKQQKRIRDYKIAGFLDKAEKQMAKNQWAESIDLYKKALDLDPGNDKAKKKIAFAYYNLSIEMKKSDNLLQSFQLLTQALEFDPGFSRAEEEMLSLKPLLQKKAQELNRNGLKEYSRGNLQKAIDIWKQALEFDQDFTKAKENLQRAYKDMESK